MIVGNIKVTIITVSYNAQRTIEQTIQSVVNQTYNNIEYIIIDGGSTDGTVDVIKKYEDKIAYWISESDKGIYDAMNKGMDIATGDYIYFLGADDSLVEKSILDTISACLLENKCEILSARVWMVDEAYNLQKISKQNIVKQMIFKGAMLPHQGMFVKAKLMKKYHFDCNYKVAADYDFLMKCIKNKVNIVYIDKSVAFFAISGMSTVFEKQREDEYNQIMQKNGFEKVQGVKNNFMKKALKKIFVFCGAWRYVQKKRGWSDHSCKNARCRWCKND
jgi:glycosyltransferase involved in cell wall biosynthesis